MWLIADGFGSVQSILCILWVHGSLCCREWTARVWGFWRFELKISIKLWSIDHRNSTQPNYRRTWSEYQNTKDNYNNQVQSNFLVILLIFQCWSCSSSFDSVNELSIHVAMLWCSCFDRWSPLWGKKTGLFILLSFFARNHKILSVRFRMFINRILTRLQHKFNVNKKCFRFASLVSLSFSWSFKEWGSDEDVAEGK